MPHVIGTAGHVDHGKSTLVQALTGIDPDRLAEEKARGLTIDLGFAWMTLPSGREVGFVDVPGHERFVHNMLAGVGGIGCALLVVDAAEGWRPQSAEHLAILDLLGLRAGVVALTKVDLVDADTRAVVTAEVAARLDGTGLAGSEIVPTAVPPAPARPSGLDELRAALDRALDRAGEPPDRGRPRLPVDRVFSVRGAGTVVTGTLTGGRLTAETEAELLPAGGRQRRRVRVRSLHSHGKPIDLAEPARRVAANLAGVAVEDIERGDMLVLPGQWRATQVADARIRCLASAPSPLRGRGAYLLYAGTTETGVRLQPLDAHEIPPGQTGLVRLYLQRPLALDAFEPVVLRDTGTDETVGGGPVLDPFPAWRVRGTAARVRRVEELEAREAAGRHGLLERCLAERGVAALADLPWLTAASEGTLRATLDRLVTAGRAVRTRSAAWSPEGYAAAKRAVLDAVAAHHRTEPLSAGLPAQVARQAAGQVAGLAPGRPPTTAPATGATATARAARERAGARPPAARPPAGRGPAGTGGQGTTRTRERAGANATAMAAAPGSATATAGAEVVEALVGEGALVAEGPVVRLPGHGMRLSPRQEQARRSVEQAIDTAGVAVLTERELAELGADRPLVAALTRLGVLVQLAPGVWLGARALDRAVELLRDAFGDGRPFSASEARSVLDTSRKTVIPLLEHLDRTGVTIRTGDARRLTGGTGGPPPSASGPSASQPSPPGPSASGSAAPRPSASGSAAPRPSASGPSAPEHSAPGPSASKPSASASPGPGSPDPSPPASGGAARRGRR